MITYKGNVLTTDRYASAYCAYGSKNRDILKKEQIADLLQENPSNIATRYGFSYRGARASAITLDRALAMWAKGWYDVDIEQDKDLPGQWIVLNEYSANDMW